MCIELPTHWDLCYFNLIKQFSSCHFHSKCVSHVSAFQFIVRRRHMSLCDESKIRKKKKNEIRCNWILIIFFLDFPCHGRLTFFVSGISTKCLMNFCQTSWHFTSCETRRIKLDRILSVSFFRYGFFYVECESCEVLRRKFPATESVKTHYSIEYIFPSLLSPLAFSHSAIDECVDLLLTTSIVICWRFWCELNLWIGKSSNRLKIDILIKKI